MKKAREKFKKERDRVFKQVANATDKALEQGAQAERHLRHNANNGVTALKVSSDRDNVEAAIKASNAAVTEMSESIQKISVELDHLNDCYDLLRVDLQIVAAKKNLVNDQLAIARHLFKRLGEVKQDAVDKSTAMGVVLEEIKKASRLEVPSEEARHAARQDAKALSESAIVAKNDIVNKLLPDAKDLSKNILEALRLGKAIIQDAREIQDKHDHELAVQLGAPGSNIGRAAALVSAPELSMPAAPEVSPVLQFTSSSLSSSMSAAVSSVAPSLPVSSSKPKQ